MRGGRTLVALAAIAASWGGHLAIPPGLAAQALDLDRRRGVTFTPFVGYRIEGVRSIEETLAIGGDTTIVNDELRFRPAASVGVALGTPLVGPIRTAASFTYGFPGELERRREVEGEGTPDVEVTRNGGHFMIAKAGIGITFPDSDPQLTIHRMYGTLTLSPAIVRWDPPDVLGVDPTLTAPIDNWAFSTGAVAEAGLGSGRVSVYVALDHYIIFWDVAELASRQSRILSETQEDDVTVALHVGKMSQLFLRAGVSFAF